jgi:general stress protein 26
MAREESTEKTQAELRKRAWELAESIRLCMFTTWDGKCLQARPMDATVDEAEGALYFLTDVEGGKIDQLTKYPEIVVSFSGSTKFVTMNGEAKVSNDRSKIKEIWTATSKAWWDSADDPAIRLITFTPRQAELWDGPNLLVTTVLMLAAAVTGAKPKIGDHAKITV